MKNPAQGRRVFGELRYLCLKIYLYEYKGFAGADGVVGVVALVVPDFSRLFDHGRGFRAVRQSLQFRAGRRLRYGYRTPQHLPVDSGRYVRLYVRRAADAHRDAGFRRAVRYAHGAGCCRSLPASSSRPASCSPTVSSCCQVWPSSVSDWVRATLLPTAGC